MAVSIMEQKIQDLLAELKSLSPSSAAEMEEIRLRFLGKKGLMKELYAELKDVPNESKKEVGQHINTLRDTVEGLLEEWKTSFGSVQDEGPKEDLSRPHGALPIGSRHPLSIVRRDILEIFSRIGFTVAEGPEIEDDWHVFSGLNFPPEHPARDMQDTFFIEKILICFCVLIPPVFKYGKWKSANLQFVL